MYRLQVVAGPDEGKYLDLTYGDTCLIGRSKSRCSLVLTDIDVSRVHMRIEVAQDGTITIIDENSRNGLYLNDKLINEKTSIVPGEQFKIGNSILQLIESEAGADSLQKPLSSNKSADNDSPEIHKKDGSTLRYSRSFPIFHNLTIGRGTSNSIVLDHPEVSRYHAQIKYRDGQYHIKDLNSTNGIYIDGVKIDSYAPLNRGANVKLGGNHLLFDGEKIFSEGKPGDIVKKSDLAALSEKYQVGMINQKQALILFTIIMLGLFGLFLSMTAEQSFFSNTINFLLGMVQPLGLLAIVLYFDREALQQPGQILKLFFLGGLLAIIGSLAIQLPLQDLPFFLGRGIAVQARIHFLITAPSEEFFKLAVALLFIWRNRSPKRVADGILFCGTVAAGFSMLENFLYIAGTGSPTFTAILRNILGGHEFWGIIMGYFAGLAIFEASTKKRNIYLFIAFFIPYLLHASYNTLAGGEMLFGAQFITLFSAGLAMWLLKKNLDQRL